MKRSTCIKLKFLSFKRNWFSASTGYRSHLFNIFKIYITAFTINITACVIHAVFICWSMWIIYLNIIVLRTSCMIDTWIIERLVMRQLILHRSCIITLSAYPFLDIQWSILIIRKFLFDIRNIILWIEEHIIFLLFSFLIRVAGVIFLVFLFYFFNSFVYILNYSAPTHYWCLLK